jgi:lysophospholipase L1-like esterase
MKKLVSGLLVSLIGIVLTLGVIELGYRTLLLISKPQRVYNDRPHFYFQAEQAPTLQDYQYGPKSNGVFRIAVIGDSFSFGPFMQFTDTFPKILERMLNLNNTTLKAEVVNYGVPAYSTSHEVQEVTTALADGADLILLQITLNDAERKPYRPIGITLFDTWGNLQATGWKKTLLENWRSLAFVANRLHNEKTRRDYIDYFHKLFFSQHTWKGFEKSVKQIERLSRKRSTPIVAVVFPLYGVALDDNYPFLDIHEKIEGLLRSLNVPTLDLFESFRGVPLERIQVIPGEDRHPNEIGHRIAAEDIYSWLESEQRIPAELVIKKKYAKRTQIVKEQPYTAEGPSHGIPRLK